MKTLNVIGILAVLLTVGIGIALADGSDADSETADQQLSEVAEYLGARTNGNTVDKTAHDPSFYWVGNNLTLYGQNSGTYEGVHGNVAAYVGTRWAVLVCDDEWSDLLVAGDYMRGGTYSGHKSTTIPGENGICTVYSATYTSIDGDEVTVRAAIAAVYGDFIFVSDSNGGNSSCTPYVYAEYLTFGTIGFASINNPSGEAESWADEIVADPVGYYSETIGDFIDSVDMAVGEPTTWTASETIEGNTETNFQIVVSGWDADHFAGWSAVNSDGVFYNIYPYGNKESVGIEFGSHMGDGNTILTVSNGYDTCTVDVRYKVSYDSTVTFHSDGETYLRMEYSFYNEDPLSIGKVPEPTKDGYVFKGWSTYPDAVAETTTVTIDTYDLYAVWSNSNADVVESYTGISAQTIIMVVAALGFLGLVAGTVTRNPIIILTSIVMLVIAGWLMV